MLYLAVGNDDLGIRQCDLGIFIGKVARIKEDRTILFAHGNGKLIHDTAVTTIEIILRILTDQSQICHRKISKSIKITQDSPGQYL